MRPLRFLHLTTFYPPYAFGGDAVYLHRLARALAERGHEVDVVHCVDSYRLLHPKEPETPVTEQPGVTVHALRSRFGRLSPILTHQTGRPLLKHGALRAILDRKRYDVLHFHNVSLLGPGALALDPRCGPLLKVYTAHEHWLVCPTHVLWKFGRRPCERPQCLPCVLHARRPPQLWRVGRLLDRSARHVDLFLAPSRFPAALHAARGFSRPFEILPNFADRSDHDWQKPAPSPHPRPYFLFVGRLEPVKGLSTLIPLWSRVGGADLVVAGSGSEETKLRSLAGDDGRIRFLGAVPPERLGPLYAHAQATILPSVTYESFPIVIPESLARKTPVIARDLGALGELVAESGGGITYRTDEELLAALAGIFETPGLRSELGERGYRTFVERWSTEPHLERYFELLRETARRKLGTVPWEGRP